MEISEPLKNKSAELLRAAAPCIGEQLLVLMVNIISMAIIGHVGKNELTAVSMVNQLVNWLQFLFVGLSTGTTVVIARLWGVKDKNGVRHAFVESINLGLIIGVVLTSLTVIFSTFLVNLFFGGAEPEVLENLHIYFSYSMYGLPFMAILTITNASVRGTGDNRTPLISTLVLNASNIILSYSLIYGIPFLHIPSFGIHGAGIGITSARVISCVFVLLYVKLRKMPILPRKYYFRFNKETISRVVNVGFPSSVEQLIFQGGFVILQSLLSPFGAAFQGGYQISGTVNGLAWAPANGVAVALTTLISQYISRKDYEGAKQLASCAKVLMLATGAVICVVMLTAAGPMSMMFSNEADVLSSAKIFIRVFGCLVLPLNYSIALAGVLRGAGDAKSSGVTCTFGMWLGRILMVWGLGKLTGNGYLAVGVGVAADFITRAFMYHFRVRKGNWLYIKV